MLRSGSIEEFHEDFKNDIEKYYTNDVSEKNIKRINEQIECMTVGEYNYCKKIYNKIKNEYDLENNKIDDNMLSFIIKEIK